MFKLFMEGGLIFMSFLTVLLVAVFFAAWKAPRWVKEIGAFALVAGFLSFILGLRRLFSTLQQVAMANDSVSGIFDLISPGVFFGGIKVGLIPVIYGIFIYLVSLVVRVIQKPRL
ncbi:MAG: hypothetical protein IJK48_00055 [Bacteroidales bacterium]|nr:hypothetical protein [Bacteroidales bacterium]